MDQSIQDRIKQIVWGDVETQLSETGYALTGPLLTSAECEFLTEIFSKEDSFRSHVVMERYRFGKGDYKYFRYPLPEIVEALRTATYPHLAQIANEWAPKLGSKERSFPLDHKEFLTRCHHAGQTQPTPLLLHYEAGGYNCLH